MKKKFTNRNKPSSKNYFFAFVNFFLRLATLFVLFQVKSVNGQSVSTYSYAQSTGIYTALATGTTLASGTTSSTIYTNQAIGFNFIFNCQTYTNLGVSTNGFIWFGTGTPSVGGLAPIGNASANLGGAGTIDGIIAAYGGNTITMQGFAAGSYIRTQLSGPLGSQIFKIEWSGYIVGGGSGSATLPSYQLWLYEGTNVIEEYVADQNSLFIATTVQGQIGLRGSSNADVRCLSTPLVANTTWNIPASTTVNTSTVYIDGALAGIYCGTLVRKFTWTPTQSCCTQPSTNATAFGFTSLVPASGTATVGFTRGTGTGGVIMIAKDGSMPTGPSNGTAYTPANANVNLGSGTSLGGGFLVFVENGASSGLRTINLTGLTSGHSYYFAIYEYNSVANCYFATALSGGFCFGPPSVASVSPSPTSVCLGTSTTLSLTGLSPGTFYTYQWQYSAISGSGYGIASGSSTNSTYATPTTLPSDPSYYVCQVTCPNTVDMTMSNQGIVNVNSFLNCYCIPTVSTPSALDNILNITLSDISITNSINNTTVGTTSPLYTLYSTFTPAGGYPNSAAPILAAGNTYPLGALKVKSGAQAASRIQAWIDFNHDGTFNMTPIASGGEYLGVSAAGNYNVTVYSFPAFTIPATSLSGITALRIMECRTTSAASSCTLGSVRGETEDYRIQITTCTPPTIQASANSSTAITTSSGTINWTTGNGTAGDILVIKQGSAVNSDPVQGNVYTPNSLFGSGTQIGSGNYVAYQGAAHTVNVSGLTLNTTYYYAIYTYNSGSLCYKTPALTGSFTTLNGPMTYISSTTIQQTGNISQGASNQSIIKVQVVMGAGSSPSITLNSLTFNTNGSTAIGNDITSARIWYTGNNSTFATTTQFGIDITSYVGNIPVTGVQVLLPGINYFWIAFDVNISAAISNLLDAECTSINIGSVQIPSVTAPIGSRPIVALAGLSCAYTGTNQTISMSTIVGVAGTTTIASGTAIDDNNYPSQSLPVGFNFEFNGQNFTSMGINSNGFIWFGSGTPNTNSYSPIGSLIAGGTINGIICPFGTDLIAHPHTSYSPATPSISVAVTGVSPNRIYTIEWNGFYNKAIYNTGTDGGCYPTALFGIFYSDAHRLDFQIKLYETGGVNSSRIEFVYRDQNPVCINTGYSYQIGLRGSSASDYLTRANSGSLTPISSTNGGAATTTNIFGGGNYINGNVGIRFTPNILTPTISPSPTAANVCPATTVTLTGSVLAPASPNWQWYKNGISIPSATASTYSVTATGTYVVVASNAGCGRVSTSTTATITPCCVTGTWIGVVSTDWNTAGNWCGNVIPVSTTNVIINSGTPNDPLVSGVGPIATCNNLTINAGASLSIASNTLNMKGDLTISPTGFFVHYGGTFELNGTTIQTIPDISTYDLKINNAAGVVITGDVIVSNTLNLFNGILNTGGSIVRVTNPTAGAIMGFNNTNYINGRLIRYIDNGLTFDFPVGDATHFELASVTVNNLFPTLYLLCEFFTDNFFCTPVPNGGGGPYVNGSPITSMLDYGFWTITPDDQPVSGTYNIQLNERGYSIQPASPAYCAVIKRDDCFSNWQSLGVHVNGTQIIGGGTVTAVRTALSSFSDFVIGFGGSVLPIQLSEFTADYYGNNNIDAILKWSTASELNCNHFDIEVSTEQTPDGELIFRKIGEIIGNGTSINIKNYSFIDKELKKSGTRYYRLKEVDNNGDHFYSQIVSLAFGTEPVILSTLYPNPSNQFVNYELVSTGNNNILISITNLLGQEMYSEQLKLKEGINKLNVNVEILSEGIYFLNIYPIGSSEIHCKFEKYAE